MQVSKGSRSAWESRSPALPQQCSGNDPYIREPEYASDFITRSINIHRMQRPCRTAPFRGEERFLSCGQGLRHHSYLCSTRDARATTLQCLIDRLRALMLAARPHCGRACASSICETRMRKPMQMCSVRRGVEGISCCHSASRSRVGTARIRAYFRHMMQEIARHRVLAAKLPWMIKAAPRLPKTTVTLNWQ